MSFMLTVWLSLPFILKLACKSGSSVSLLHEKHLGSCKIDSSKIKLWITSIGCFETNKLTSERWGKLGKMTCFRNLVRIPSVFHTWFLDCEHRYSTFSSRMLHGLMLPEVQRAYSDKNLYSSKK